MPNHWDNSDIWLYRVAVARDSDAESWQKVCDGDGTGVFVDGQWLGNGDWHPGGYTFSCPRGVAAKCARSWGYKPWQTRDGTLIDLFDRYGSNVRESEHPFAFEASFDVHGAAVLGHRRIARRMSEVDDDLASCGKGPDGSDPASAIIHVWSGPGQ
jgi:hypothetical protein